MLGEQDLVDVSDICSGQGEKGGSEAPGGGGGDCFFFIENPRRGAGLQGRRGREGVCGELGIWGGGAVNFFFRGRNVHQEEQVTKTRVFGKEAKSARGAIAILAAVTTLETCLEPPFIRMIANELLHSKQQKECNRVSTTADHCVA